MEHLMVKTRKDLDAKNKSKKPSLDDLTLADLKVLHLRQSKLLSNPHILKNLADGGEKLRVHLSNIEAVMELKEKYDNTIQALGDMKIEESKPPASPSSSTIRSRGSTSEIMDSDKLDRVRSRIAQRSSHGSTQLLSGEEVQEIARRDKRREETGLKLGDFLGMFKIEERSGESSRVKAGNYRVRMEGEESDSDSEVSDHSRSSGGGYGESDELGLLEECLYDNTQ